MAPELNNKDEI